MKNGVYIAPDGELILMGKKYTYSRLNKYNPGSLGLGAYLAYIFFIGQCEYLGKL